MSQYGKKRGILLIDWKCCLDENFQKCEGDSGVKRYYFISFLL